MIDVVKKLMVLFSERERRRFCVLMAVMVFVAFAEVFGISTILVLLQILSDPNKIFENQYLNWMYELFGFATTFGFQVFLAIVVLIVVMLSMLVKAGGNYAIIRFSTMRGFTLSSRLLQAYLHQPYTWFLERNSADVKKSVLGEIQNLVNKIIVPGSRLLSNLLLAVSILGFLLFVDPLVAIVSSVMLGGAYAAIYLKMRVKLLRLGEEILAANKERFRLTQEATDGFKEVKLMGLEESYVSSFKNPARRLARSAALSQVINQIPRYALEALTYAVLMAIILFMIFRDSGDLTQAIPILGVFAISVMRLLPALQQIYSAIASIRNSKPVLDHIYNDYCDAMAQRVKEPIGATETNKLPVEEGIVLDKVRFQYASGEKPAVNDLDLTISAFSTIGIVGGTGAGKTTVVDLILGLLIPEKGEIRIDGTVLNRENIHAWRRSLGYVPQTIYLTDSTVARNIAFSTGDGPIDMAAVERAAKTAMLHDFVMNELPDGYETMVGERGVRLSGGQRQRIGIARALYHDPSLLILDEATSALDNLTERAVMSAVQNIRNDKTIIMIAHRLSTVKKCDQIILLERGKVASIGTYDELVESNETFRRMAANE